LTAATPDEVWKARAEFQREIYRVADARVASFDTQLGVIIAAAVALVGFGAGAATSREVTSSSLITAVAAAAVTALLALCARQELPWLWLPVLHARMKRAAWEAETAVGAIHAGGRPTAADDPYHEVFNAWYAVSKSIEARRKLKQAIYAMAVLGLFVELGLVLAVLARAGSN
jgi:hypothetical protein